MSRAIDWEETVNTSTFSAVQLQPGVVASLTWNALARWLRTYLVSFPTLIAKESTGLVVMGFHLDYRDPVSFFDFQNVSHQFSTLLVFSMDSASASAFLQRSAQFTGSTGRKPTLFPATAGAPAKRVSMAERP